MTTDERLTRLERGLAVLAEGITQHYPLRGSTPGHDALRELVAEHQEQAKGEHADRERERLEGELAKLGAAA